jgi:hypothetical protein
MLIILTCQLGLQHIAEFYFKCIKGSPQSGTHRRSRRSGSACCPVGLRDLVGEELEIFLSVQHWRRLDAMYLGTRPSRWRVNDQMSKLYCILWIFQVRKIHVTDFGWLGNEFRMPRTSRILGGGAGVRRFVGRWERGWFALVVGLRACARSARGRKKGVWAGAAVGLRRGDHSPAPKPVQII